jgi:tetratricopeptide (TPR) repeat protein
MKERSHMLEPLFDVGEWDECLRLADEAVAEGREHEDTIIRDQALFTKALLLVWRGQAEQAFPLGDELLKEARSSEVPAFLSAVLLLVALIELARDRHSRAVDLIVEFKQLTSEHPTWNIRTILDVVRFLVATGEVDLAHDLVAEKEASTAIDRAGLLAAEAILTEARGQFAVASDLYDDSTAQWRSLGCVFEVGQGLLGSGRCLLELGRTAEATARIQDARAVFEKLGAGPLIRAANLLTEAAIPTLGRAPVPRRRLGNQAEA